MTMGRTRYYVLFMLLSRCRTVIAAVNWTSLLNETRRLSMSGVLGLLDTDILFAEPGSSQPEYFRIAQTVLGIGALRVLGKICQMPCFEVLHLMHGIKPPEAIKAREFWLNQESWTELTRQSMGHEDTSYHRINQGSGPQAKILYNWSEIEKEREWWGELRVDPETRNIMPSTGAPPMVDAQSPQATHSRFSVVGNTVVSVAGKNGEELSEGTTDKWWMDRWQIEVLAVANAHQITLEVACELLTVAYFGQNDGRTRQLVAALLCVLLTVGTFVTAHFTDWSWIPQFFALSSLGYMVNWTASLRSWRFEPSSALKNYQPTIYNCWPNSEDPNEAIIRIGVQCSGTAHLRGLAVISKNDLQAAIEEAFKRRGRYGISREQNKLKIPYSLRMLGNEQGTVAQPTVRAERFWISFEAQSSYYGLLASVTPDNVTRRSLGVVLTMIVGILLIILGFGATTPPEWNGWVLLIYIIGICTAVATRRRESVWTLPEFQKVDLTTFLDLPPTVKARIEKLITKKVNESLYRGLCDTLGKEEMYQEVEKDIELTMA